MLNISEYGRSVQEKQVKPSITTHKLQDQAGRVRVAAAENKAAAAKLELESLQRVSWLQCTHLKT